MHEFLPTDGRDFPDPYVGRPVAWPAGCSGRTVLWAKQTGVELGHAVRKLTAQMIPQCHIQHIWDSQMSDCLEILGKVSSTTHVAQLSKIHSGDLELLSKLNQTIYPRSVHYLDSVSVTEQYEHYVLHT